MRGACKIDPSADNTIEKLKASGGGGTGGNRRQTVMKPTAGASNTNSDMLQSTGAANTGHIYILERDTKFVYEY